MQNTMKLRDLRVHAAQMRTTIDPDRLAGLVQQILTAGLDPNRPIVVAADGAVISGHRRWLAWMIGLAVKDTRPDVEEYDLPTILDVIDELAEQAHGNLTDAFLLLQERYGEGDIPVARSDGDERAQILALQSANFGQEEADPKGLAQSFYAAMQAGISVKQIAHNIGQKVSWVESYLALATLPDELVNLIVAKKLAQGVAVALADLPETKKTALAKVIAAHTQAGSPPSVSSVQAMVKRLKAFNGFTPPMTSDPQERNKARVLAVLWRKTLNEQPDTAWVVAADGAFNDILDEPWNNAQVATAFVRAFAPNLVVNGSQVNWPQAMNTFLPGAACAHCVVNSLPETRLQSELDLPCRRGKTMNGVCVRFSTAQESFAYDVPWEWAGLPGVSPDRPYRVVTGAGLREAWQARQTAEAGEANAANDPAPQTKPPSGNGTPPPKSANGSAPKTQKDEPKESPVAKMREAIRNFMAHHMELGGAHHPLATRCKACRHFRDSSPTKDETVPHCEWAGRLRKVDFSVRQPGNGAGQPIPWCHQYAPKETDWSKVIPAHDGSQMPRAWLEAQIAYLAADIASVYGDQMLLSPLTGKPMNASEKCNDWFEKEYKKQVGNLSDAQLWTLYIWTLADWQRTKGSRNDSVLFPIDAQAETFAAYQVIGFAK